MSLMIPSHVAAAEEKRRATEAAKAAEEREWHEDGLAAADLPRPAGYRLMVQPVELEHKTKGGIIIADQSRSDAKYVCYVGKVIATGTDAYQHPKFNGADPWCQPGDFVVYGRYAGQEVKVRGESGKLHTFRFVNDDEILAVTDAPEKLSFYL